MRYVAGLLGKTPQYGGSDGKPLPRLVPHLIADAHGHDDEDPDEQHGDREEDDGERLDEQPRRLGRHGTSSTGTVRSTVAGRPASTRRPRAFSS